MLGRRRRSSVGKRRVPGPYDPEEMEPFLFVRDFDFAA